jgi:hypothetical protein
MGWADQITRDQVKNLDTLADYCRQVAGVPYPTKQMKGKALKEAKRLMEEYPTLTWPGLANLAHWAKDNKCRFSSFVPLLASFRYAYRDGYMPELEVTEDGRIEELLEAALAVETDQEWRRRLITARGNGRKIVYAAWHKQVNAT